MKLNRRQAISGAALTLAAPTLLSAPPAKADDMHGPPKVDKGTITYLPNFKSKHVSPRDVAIWVPDTTHHKGPLPVIYAGDGENLFDADASKYGSGWNLDLILDMLAHQGIGPAIVVANAAIHLERSREYNSPTIARYFDAQMKQMLAQSCNGELLTEAYFDFIITELKPYIDANFDTKPDRGNTYILGQSMGGMLAVEALMARPEVFSGALGFSAHLFLFGPQQVNYPPDTFDRVEAALQQAIAEHFPPPGNAKVYVDRGTVDLDAMYARPHIAFENALKEKGYIAGKDYIAITQEGASHFDTFWKIRAPEALRFMLG
ncbi:alpha/beta hydrolase [Polycladidibacter hongkongensis]|uniref:alpha/beta hydrolase n=1 Tax=Polycladidibacter hongkongensis TaxID=1647556 RepID=UPI00082C3CB1|nr:alpha/beta hydrolase-fold protein [Pseudovibrio hongkongensis]